MKDPRTICPKCGNRSVQTGFGLAGGGFGEYFFCERGLVAPEDPCDFFFKIQECPVCEGPIDPNTKLCDCGDEQARAFALAAKNPPRCGACMRVVGARSFDGRCAQICSDGMPCGGPLPTEGEHVVH